ncbi:hypothetical protein GR183_08435 [Stappia sp. GBMRC 2046]|uniref:Uncharacterized protein n=1 Tax=Stappia sediminis TaxID=2692190 RepID=A0A7X3S7M3_9HYPH|nr:hypothetical protein [Stappia sediminis]MXN64933.1 hypothetical protein [Stappia sediminis]
MRLIDVLEFRFTGAKPKPQHDGFHEGKKLAARRIALRLEPAAGRHLVDIPPGLNLAAAFEWDQAISVSPNSNRQQLLRSVFRR